MIKLAIVGAESSGKSTLARQLAMAPALNPDKSLLISEPLRQWCIDNKRTPDASEQAALMAAHIRQCDRAMATLSGAHTEAGDFKNPAQAEVLICDTTALQTAAYRVYYFGDTGLDPAAIAHHRRFDFTLLMGLDLPWVADPGQRSGPASQGPVDQRLRYLLDAAQVPYAVVYGIGPVRLDRALAVLARIKPMVFDRTASRVPEQVPGSGRPAWRTHCETCGNAECEHRLFRHLKGLE